MLFKTQDLKNENNISSAKILSGQITNISEAVNAYINLNYSNLAALKSIGSNEQYGPLNCDTGNSSCNITIDTLKNSHLINSEFNNKTILGNEYIIQLKREGVSPNYMISGVVITDGKNSRDNQINKIVIGETIKNIGADAGIMNKTSSMNGVYGSWNTNSLTYSILNNKKDYIGVLVGYNANMYSIYLRRDGTLPMTGVLNMDGHNISNIQDFNAYGNGTINGSLSVDKDISSSGNGKFKGDLYSEKNITAKGNITSGNWLIAHNGGGNTIYIGGDASPHANGTLANDYEIKMDTAKPLTIWNTAMSNDRNQTLLEVWGVRKC